MADLGRLPPFAMRSLHRISRFLLSSLRILIHPTVGRPGSFVGGVINHVGIWGPLLFVHLATVWTLGNPIGLPRLIWRVVEDPFSAFLGAVTIGFLLGLGVFLFFVLNYSDWLGERRAFRALVRNKFATGRENEVNNGPVHWSNDLYADFKTGRQLAPNDDIQAMAKFQGYLFRHLFAMVLIGWFALWLLQPFLFHHFHLRFVHQLSASPGPAGLKHWWLVPLGFAIGASFVFLVAWMNQSVYAHVSWIRRRSQHLTEYLHKGRPEQEIERNELYDESPLMAYFILSAAFVFAIHLCFLLLDAFNSPVHFPVVALCIFLAELMLLYTGLCLLFRRKSVEMWAIASMALVILVQWQNDGILALIQPRLQDKLRLLVAPVAFAAWMLPVAIFLGCCRKGIEAWFLAGTLLLLGLLPYTGHRYLFRSLEESNSKEIFKELAGVDGPLAPIPEQPIPMLYLQTGTEPPAWSSRQQRPLVVLCASGGGITAEVWAYKMLKAFEKLPGFTQDLRVITGASGGMVGAAIWISDQSFHKQHPGNFKLPERFSDKRIDQLDQLSRVTQRLALWDLSWGAVLQRIPLWPFNLTKYQDRGNLLEAVWKEEFPPLAISLPEILPFERSGDLPSLIFSPMLAQDGRRLLISNLNLAPLKCAGWGSGASMDRVRSAIQAEAGTLEGIPLTTWARMSATFPIVSPAACLPQRPPSNPPRNPVDAGYYDNDGTNLAVGWIRECYLPWLETQLEAGNAQVQPPSCIVLVELDAYPRLRKVPLRQRLTGNLFFEDVKHVATGASQRVRSIHFRNDEEIEALGRFGHIPIHSVRFECSVDASLSWALTDVERRAISERAERCEHLQPEEFARLRKLFPQP